MAKTKHARILESDLDYLKSQIDNRNVKDIAAALSITIDKAVAYDKYCAALNNDCR